MDQDLSEWSWAIRETKLSRQFRTLNAGDLTAETEWNPPYELVSNPSSPAFHPYR